MIITQVPTANVVWQCSAHTTKSQRQKFLKGAHTLSINFSSFEVGTASFINTGSIISQGHKPQNQIQGSPLLVST